MKWTIVAPMEKGASNGLTISRFPPERASSRQSLMLSCRGSCCPVLASPVGRSDTILRQPIQAVHSSLRVASFLQPGNLFLATVLGQLDLGNPVDAFDPP